MDQGIIENIKRLYRKQLLQFLIEGIHDGEVIQNLKLVKGWNSKRIISKSVEKIVVNGAVFETNDSLQIVCDNSDVNNEVLSNMFKLLPGNIPDMEVEAWLSPSTNE